MEEVIDKLPDGFNTYLHPPIYNQYGGPLNGAMMFDPRKMDHTAVERAAGIRASQNIALSGGQMQKLAV